MSLFTYLKNPRRIAIGILKRVNPYISEKLYLQLRYFFEIGEWPNLTHPRLFNEKLQWLKLYNRKKEYTKMVDKYAVKDFVSQKVGMEYVIPTLGVWDNVNDIDFDSLPNKFVLKTTHGGGGCGVVICKNKEIFDKKQAISKLLRSMSENPYYEFKEWPYKDVKPRIIAEEYMEDEEKKDLIDYKFFCFNGVPKLCQVISDRSTDEKIDFYDMNWKKIEGLIGLNPKVSNGSLYHDIPSCFDTMKNIASILSDGTQFSRIDLYYIKGKCFFGEITFFPASGFGFFRPKDWNEKIGNWISLS